MLQAVDVLITDFSAVIQTIKLAFSLTRGKQNQNHDTTELQLARKVANLYRPGMTAIKDNDCECGECKKCVELTDRLFWEVYFINNTKCVGQVVVIFKSDTTAEAVRGAAYVTQHISQIAVETTLYWVQQMTPTNSYWRSDRRRVTFPHDKEYDPFHTPLRFLHSTDSVPKCFLPQVPFHWTPAVLAKTGCHSKHWFDSSAGNRFRSAVVQWAKGDLLGSQQLHRCGPSKLCQYLNEHLVPPELLLKFVDMNDWCTVDNLRAISPSNVIATSSQGKDSNVDAISGDVQSEEEAELSPAPSTPSDSSDSEQETRQVELDSSNDEEDSDSRNEFLQERRAQIARNQEVLRQLDIKHAQQELRHLHR